MRKSSGGSHGPATNTPLIRIDRIVFDFLGYRDVTHSPIQVPSHDKDRADTGNAADAASGLHMHIRSESEMTRLILISLLLLSSAQAQSITIAPTSIHLWGKTPGMMEMAVSYKDIGVHYFHNHSPSVLAYQSDQGVRIDHILPDMTGRYVIEQTRSNIAASYTPVKIGGIIRAGGMLFANQFPIRSGQRLNFFLDIGYNFDRFRISYSHLSNGFGLVNEINPGLDSIRIKVALN